MGNAGAVAFWAAKVDRSPIGGNLQRAEKAWEHEWHTCYPNGAAAVAGFTTHELVSALAWSGGTPSWDDRIVRSIPGCFELPKWRAYVIVADLARPLPET